MDFIYFKGPHSDMSELLDKKTTCSICGKTDNCFELDYAITKEFDQDEKEGKVGCYSCLREGKFEFWHDTEFGMLDEDGLKKVYNHNMSNPPTIAKDILTEMMRTPRIITWQQELWLTHCNDFMVYKGTWEPKDFYLNSVDGDGKKLFLEMTDEQLSHLWDESLAEGQHKLEEWYPTYYAFQCRHCNKLRGNWDCD